MKLLVKIFSLIKISSVLSNRILICLFIALLLPNVVLSQQIDTLWSEDWESGIGFWYADNGVWDVGSPGAGPATCYSGTQCAGTIPNGNYPNSANSRLISPQISLPSLSSNEKLKLKFWHWFWIDNNPYDYDYGYVQISQDDGQTWEKISGTFDEYSSVWTQPYLDISKYQNSIIRIAFYFISSPRDVKAGWYIDDIFVIKGKDLFNNPEDFESGISDWGVDNGTWEIGTPTAGPDTCHSGQICAGTVLDGNYFNAANTRLITPEITLTPVENMNPELYFWHWHRLDNNPYDYDYGVVQISTDGGKNWVTISGNFDEYSEVWSQARVSLAAYKDSTVHIGFYLETSPRDVDKGWYIDDVQIINIEGIDTSTFINEFKNTVPLKFFLYQSYPNPFNPVTHIPFSLPKAANVKIEIYNLLGQQVATLLDDRKQAGYHSVSFNGSNLSSGIYLYRIQAGEFQQVRKMLLVK